MYTVEDVVTVWASGVVVACVLMHVAGLLLALGVHQMEDT